MASPAADSGEHPILGTLNHALGHAITCYLRHKQEFFAASDSGGGAVAGELLEHADQDLGRARLLAARIEKLGGAPDFAPQEFADADRIAMRLTAR